MILNQKCACEGTTTMHAYSKNYTRTFTKHVSCGSVSVVNSFSFDQLALWKNHIQQEVTLFDQFLIILFSWIHYKSRYRALTNKQQGWTLSKV